MINMTVRNTGVNGDYKTLTQASKPFWFLKGLFRFQRFEESPSGDCISPASRGVPSLRVHDTPLCGVAILNEYSMNEGNVTTPMTKRQQQAEARRRQLLDTALQLFAERGFDRTTIKDICQAAGVAQGLVYHYFPSKEAMLSTIVEEQSFLPALRDLLAVPPDRPAAEVLALVATGFAALLSERGQVLRVVSREAQVNPVVATILQRMIHESVELLAGYLDARIQAGELRPHDTRVTARALFFPVVTLRLSHTPDDALLPDLVDTLLHGIAVQHEGGG